MILPATPANIARAAELIRAGDSVAFPTETVYGLGADATNAVAVASIFEIKDRPSFDPLIVHLADPDRLADVARNVPRDARALMERFWPGPLTLILAKSDRIPDIVTADLPSVAGRVPDHRVAREMIRMADRPIAAPSANRFGGISPTAAQHVQAQLGERPGMILDDGPCAIGVESTIISFLSARPALLRPGGLAVERIIDMIGPVDLVSKVDPRLAPGQSSRHYAPTTQLHVVRSAREVPSIERPNAALLVVDSNEAAPGFRCVEALANDGSLVTAAANLFSALHRLDAAGVRKIYAVAVPEEGLGRAIMDRLRRAAHG
jgi:L-threonylcarbamoyladenylate synthase